MLKATYFYRWFFVDAETERRILLAEQSVARPAPENFAVVSNYPNPFQDQTQLVLDLPEDTHVALTIRDILGREVQQVVDRPLVAGRHRFTIDGSNWATGIYFAQMTTESATTNRRMVVMR